MRTYLLASAGAAALLCSATDGHPQTGGGGKPTATTADKPLWQRIIDGVSSFVTATAPLVEGLAAVDPALAPAINLGEKLLQGVLASEPTAVQFWNQIQAGKPPTQAQLTQWAADYDASYAKLKADIAAQLAALPPGE